MGRVTLGDRYERERCVQGTGGGLQIRRCLRRGSGPAENFLDKRLAQSHYKNQVMEGRGESPRQKSQKP